MTRCGEGVRAVVTQLGSETSVHGVPRIVQPGNTYRRVAWTCFVIMGLITAGLHLSIMVTKFLSYPMVEVSRVRQDLQVPFPSVTICNIAAVSGKEQAQRKVRLDEYNAFTTFLYTKHWSIIPDREQVAWLNSPQGGYENYPSYMKSHAHTYDQFILQCRFNKKNCSEGNFTMHFDGANYYSCFTFNSGSGSENGVVARRTSAEYGLSLILAMDNDIAVRYDWYNTKSNTAGGSGVRVVIHEHNTLPFPAEHGFDIPPGYTTSVSLRASLRTQLPKPHGNCSNSDDRLQAKKHTLFSCLQLCQQNVIINECGCKTSALPEPETAKNLTYCGVVKGWHEAYEKRYKQVEVKYYETNSTLDKQKYIFDNMDIYEMTIDSDVAIKDLSCKENVRDKLKDDRSYEKNCDCKIPCSELQYKTAMSISYWPLEMYQHNLVRDLKRTDSGYPEEFKNSFLYNAFKQMEDGATFEEKERLENITMPWEEKFKLQYASKLFRQNMLRLNIYMEDLTVMELKQEEAYSITDLAADVGGTLGLWMGISVLSSLELLELIMRLVGLLRPSGNKTGTASARVIDVSAKGE